MVCVVILFIMKKFILTVGGIYLLTRILRPVDHSIEGIGRLEKFRFVPVYRELPTSRSNGKTNIAWTRGQKGVYIIKENGKVVYVGSSRSQLYKTIIRHFQKWDDPRQPDRITYQTGLNKHRYTIRIIIADVRRIPLLEKGLIEKYKPRDNKFVEELDLKEEEKARDIVAQYEEANTDYPPEWDD